MYCSKGDNIIEWGDIPKQGERNDLKNILKLDEYKIIEEYPEIYVKFHKGIEKLNFKKMCKKLNKYCEVKVYTIIGKSRTGKTSYVLNKHGAENVYILDSDDGNYWFDGYNYEKV